MALDVDLDQIDREIQRQKVVDRGHLDLDGMLFAAGQCYVRHRATGWEILRVMQDAAAALTGDQHVCRDDVRIEIKIVCDDRALQALENARVAFEGVEAPVLPDDTAAECRVEPEIGADIEDDRMLGQKGPENANDVGFMLPAEDIADRLEGRG